MSKNSLQGLSAECRKLLHATETLEVELPQIGPYRHALAEALEEVAVKKSQQKLHEARRRQATREVQDGSAECREMARRLKNLITAHLGRKDDRLSAFGIKPAGRRNRRNPAEMRGKKSSPGFH